MTTDDLLLMAWNAGLSVIKQSSHWEFGGDEAAFRTFAALVASERDIGWHKIVHDECEAAIREEREACAMVCESKMPNPVKNWSDAQIVEALRNCADAIRQRKSL